MTEADWEFFEKQKKSPPVGYCDNFVDRKWEMSNKRKQNRANRSRDESLDETYVKPLQLDDVFEDPSSDEDYHGSQPKKTKYDFSEVIDDKDDNLPFAYRHIRNGERSVKKEIYIVMSTLSSVYHMSRNQIEGSIITIANELFGRKQFGEWKIYDKHKTPDNNTLPSMTNISRTESYIEAMVLDFIVQEIMDDGKFSLLFKVPNSILCNVHPLMMFQNKIKTLCQTIHDSLGTL